MVVTSHLADLPVPFLTPAFWWVGRCMAGRAEGSEGLIAAAGYGLLGSKKEGSTEGGPQNCSLRDLGGGGGELLQI